MKLRFVDGHEEVLEFSPDPPTGAAAVGDFRTQLAHAMKEGVLRMNVDNSELQIFTQSLEFIETTPAPGAPATFPWSFKRVKH